MEIHSIETFLPYFENVHERTMRVVRTIPPDRLEWSCRTPDASGEAQFTLGDLVRHIYEVERNVFCENLAGRPSRYRGCGRELADGYDAVLAFAERMHREAVEIFATLTPEQLKAKAVTPDGSPITAWKLLRALVEHEIHHRGQIYVYLGILGVPGPPIYGRTEGALRELSAGN